MKERMKKTLLISWALIVCSALIMSGCSPLEHMAATSNAEGARGDNYQTSPSTSSSMPTEDYSHGCAESLPYPGEYPIFTSGEEYLEIAENETRNASEEPEMTFSLKVDTAAYTNMKRYIENGMLPSSDSVRTEELINYFDYDKILSPTGDSPLAIYTELGPSPFDENKQLAFIRIKTEEVDKDELPPSNLVFLIDTSGSMASSDKLPLLQKAFSELVDTLDENDRVSIVTYAGSSEVILSGASGSDKDQIKHTINQLESYGSTAGEQGIQTAYELAQENSIEEGNNRVILATDGDFNVGISDINQLEDFISSKRDTGLYLSVLGFGTGNIRDDIMETLSKNGNGNYSYIDSIQTAKKVLVKELSSNLFTVADDVKAKLVFDPEAVSSYRLIGYENRIMNNKDFEDDSKDAGEIGLGSDVVILVELDTIDSHAAPFTVNIRYKNPGESESNLLEEPATPGSNMRSNTTDFGFACSVALYGDILRNPYDASREQIAAAVDLAKQNKGEDSEGYRADYIDLLQQLDGLCR